MEGVSLNTNPANLFTNDVTGSSSRSRDAQNEAPPSGTSEPPAPRVNEGPSTVTTISPQALQLAQQEQAADNDSSNPPPNSPATNATPPRNDTQQAERGDEQAASPPDEASNNATPPAQTGRLVNDQSPSAFLRG